MLFYCFLFASLDDTYSDMQEHFTNTVSEYHKYTEYQDQQILNPQKPGPSNAKDLDVGNYEKDYSVEGNPDIYLAIQKR